MTAALSQRFNFNNAIVQYGWQVGLFCRFCLQNAVCHVITCDEITVTKSLRE